MCVCACVCLYKACMQGAVKIDDKNRSNFFCSFKKIARGENFGDDFFLEDHLIFFCSLKKFARARENFGDDFFLMNDDLFF